jgi:hypothetical protein
MQRTLVHLWGQIEAWIVMQVAIWWIKRCIGLWLEVYSMWPHQGRMWCLVYACVLDFKPHQEKVIWRQQREYWDTWSIHKMLDCGICWSPLNSKYNHQLLHKVTWNNLQSIVVGFDSNKFHEFWCSHLSCRICNFHSIKVSQMINWSAPLRRARRDDQNGYITCYIWSSE